MPARRLFNTCQTALNRSIRRRRHLALPQLVLKVNRPLRRVMPTIPLHVFPHLRTTATPNPTVANASGSSDSASNPLPRLLQTPAGLALLEIQGKINISGAPSGEAVLPVGKLVFPHSDPNDVTGSQSWMKTVYLYVGKHQRLTGEVKKLPKAIAIIRKQRSGPGGLDRRNGGEEDLEIAEIVEWKILFSSRPEPVGD